MKSFSIVGAGRLGTVLGAALVRGGWRAEAVFDKDAKAARASRRLIGGGRATTDIHMPARAGDAVFLTVPDDEIGRVAAKLGRAGARWSGRSVFHASGLLPARILEPLRDRGASVASLHPVQTFPDKGAPGRIFKGITWGIEGDAAAIRVAEGIVRALRGHVLILSERDKPLYHAACSLASNALTGLEWAAAGLLARAGIDEKRAVELFSPLLQGTLQNVKELGPKRALTGPLARGDIATVRAHLKALEEYPETREVYLALGRQTLLIAIERGLAPARVSAMKRLLGRGRPLPRVGRRIDGKPVP
jgi:predicted short-subunit dehydrogenase-like oxidoreductase (DUF2520 family)